MKLIDRYILRQIIVGFMLVLISMTVLIWLTQSLRMIDMIVTRGVSAKIFLELTVLVLPNFLQILSPLALFAVALFTLIRMQSDKELMVMQAVGMSPLRIMRPIFLFAGILTIISFLFSLFVIPAANREMREMKWQIKNDLSYLLLQEGQFNAFKNGVTLYVKERKSDGRVEGIFAYEAKSPNQQTVLSANNGLVFQEPDGVRVEFHDGTRQEYHADTKQFSILKFDKYTMMFADKGTEGSRTPDVRELSLQKLWAADSQDYTNQMRLWRKHKVEFVKRLIQPFYNITFMFLVMFGVLSGHYNRRGDVARINETVGIALVIQSLALAFENRSGQNLWFLILLAGNVFVPVLFVFRPFAKRAHKKKNTRRRWHLIGGLITLLFITGNGYAASFKPAKIDSKDPVDFEADSVSYNSKKNELNATGNVIMIQGNMTLTTERITFYKADDTILAPDKITIKLTDGTVAEAASATMNSHLDSLTTEQTQVRLYEGSRLGADKIERVTNGDSYLTDAYYTPCDFCEGESPLWRLRSDTVWHDTAQKDMVYKHMWLDVKDVPVGYLPYWRMPDFTVKRRTGFLAPGLSSTHEMRKGVSIPYFIDLADNQNLTLTPIISPDHFPMGFLDYKGVFTKSTFNLQASGTKDRGETRKQGHIKADIRYDLTENWRLSSQYYRVATDTYFRRYRVPGVDDNEPFLTSHLTAERFGNRNYFRLKNYSFQSLQNGVTSSSIPVVLPVLDYQYNTAPLAGTGIYGFTAVNAALFDTRDHFKSDRLSLTQGIQMPYITPIGLDFNFKGYVRADGYAVDTGRFGFAGQSPDLHYDTGRVYPNASVTMSYPLVQNSNITTQILEPIAMLVTSSNGGNSTKIPNVDSLVFDFDDTDLFSDNRFSGYDRVEPGTRINYGLKWSRFNHTTGRSISALLGQSYRFDDDELMTGLMGYDTHFSDYVGRIQIGMPYVHILYRARLDQKTLKAQKNEVSFRVGSAPLTLGVSYVMRKAYRIGDNTYGSREEITYSASSQLTRHWKAAGTYKYDLSGKGEPVSSTASLQYDNECTTFIFEVDKSFTQDRDYKGSVSFMAKVILKTLGGM